MSETGDETDWAAFADEVLPDDDDGRTETGNGRWPGVDRDTARVVREAIGDILGPTKVTFRSKDVTAEVDIPPQLVGPALRQLEDDGVVEKVTTTKPYKWELSGSE